MRRLPLLVCILLAFAAPVVSAQEAPDATPSAGTEYAAPVGETAPAAQPTAAQSSSGLPQAAPPPRTLRAYWHVFIAFAVVWGLLFGYALMLGRRFGALERQVERLERTGA